MCKCACEMGISLGVGTWRNELLKDGPIQLNVHGNHPPCMKCDVDRMKMAEKWVTSDTAKSYWKKRFEEESA